MKHGFPRWKRVLIRFIVWLLVKFIKDPGDASMAMGANPLFGIRKYGPIIIATAEINKVEDVFKVLKENLSDLAKSILHEAKELSEPIPFKVIKGGKMQKPFKNFLDTPLITVILVTHSGDCHLLSRAINSILEQNMALDQLELLVYFDGVPTTEEHFGPIESATSNPLIDALYNCQLQNSTEKNGYYCVGRNRTTPLAQGLYIYNMDVDNEIAPNHLPNLLKEIRKPDKDGFPHFVYTRRKYIVDKGVENPPTESGTISTFIPWNPKSIAALTDGPANNFIDTGDFLVSKSALYRLSDVTGCIWNSQCRRFGDWDLMVRMVGSGFRGRALDQATNLYHWTGNNLQMTRSLSDIVVLPESIYNEMKEKGLVVD